MAVAIGIIATGRPVQHGTGVRWRRRSRRTCPRVQPHIGGVAAVVVAGIRAAATAANGTGSTASTVQALLRAERPVATEAAVLGQVLL